MERLTIRKEGREREEGKKEREKESIQGQKGKRKKVERKERR